MRAFQQEPGSAKYTSLESLETIPGNVLVVVAHPDDEVFCSGLLIQLIERNATVKILCLTKGEGGPTGDTPRNQLGEKRERKLRPFSKEWIWFCVTVAAGNIGILRIC